MTEAGAFGRVRAAEVVLPCADLEPCLDLFGALGFRIEAISPADAPRAASLSGHGLRLRLEPGPGAPGELRLLVEGPSRAPITAPNGTRIVFAPAEPDIPGGAFRPRFVFAPAAEGASPGRAGLLYRDLIPDRLGGRYIASHIIAPQGGPVADWVHFHRLDAQLIACRSGWTRLVYEDQGEPFLFAAGDVLLQPPTIRHRVLETSPGFAVVEIASPAVHDTLADHDLSLPTDRLEPNRVYGGQRFSLSRLSEAVWRPFGTGGFEASGAGLSSPSGGRIEARRLRIAAPGSSLSLEPHQGELLLGYVFAGRSRLLIGDGFDLAADDAFVIPPGEPWGLSEAAAGFELLLVAAPAVYPISE